MTISEPMIGVIRTGRPRKPPTIPTGQVVLAYTDGGCWPNPGHAASGAVVLWEGCHLELSEYIGRETNNVAELTAILRVAEIVPYRDRPVRIFTDSMYSIGVLTNPCVLLRKNVALIHRVKRAFAEFRDVRIYHVRGHTGVIHNETADALATLARRYRKSTGWVEVSEGVRVPYGRK